MTKKLSVSLGLVAVAVIGLLTGGWFVYQAVFGANVVNQGLEFTNRLNVPRLLEPEMVDGQKVFNLTLQSGETQLLAGQTTRTWGANGTYLMPTIRASRGDDVQINVVNELNEMTTMHWHGMHLPPTMDGVHQVITPGETWQPYWEVRQQAATLWYHPHLHGQTGPHVYNGLAGLFILDDENSRGLDIPSEYGVNDFPLIVQDRLFDQNNQFVYDPDDDGMFGDTLLINGTYAPYLDVPVGWVRLRILNASNARRYHFGFEDDREFYQIASDGGLLEQPVSLTRLLLGSGERAEILVNFADSEPVVLVSYDVNTAPLFGGNMDDSGQQFSVLEMRPQPDLSGVHETVPNRLNTIERYSAADATNTRQFVLGGGERINGVRMNVNRIDEVVILGSREIWEITNDSNDVHPFHIHDVQFQTLDRDGDAPPPGQMGWKDTILVGTGETVRVMMEFSDYADPHVPYMYHCHLLEHEDHGMMGQFVVVANDSVTPEVRTELSDLGLMHGGM